MEEFIEGLPLVAHNASVERACIHDCCAYYNIDTLIPYDDIMDTYILSKEIENKLGLVPDWQRLDGKKASRVLYRMSGLDFDDHSNYDSLMNEMIDKAVLFSNVFKKYV
jgi:DNA polymerase III epsilon subunit-like protein